MRITAATQVSKKSRRMEIGRAQRLFYFWYARGTWTNKQCGCLSLLAASLPPARWGIEDSGTGPDVV